jgi:signal transduction histidine kinase/DNA-binding NarL/FixJ family response regulator
MFRGSRNFTIASAVLIALALISVAVVSVYSRESERRLLQTEERHNTTIARALANSLLLTHFSYLTGIKSFDGNTLRAQPETSTLDRDIRHMTDKLSVLKTKIYYSNGTTLYSSELGEIGELELPNVISVIKDGNTLSRLNYNGNTSTFPRARTNIDFIETYLPIANEDGHVLFIIKIYSNVSNAAKAMQVEVYRFSLFLLTALAGLYCALYFAAWRANRTINDQFINLSSFNESLEKRVKERTAAADAAVKLARRTSNQISAEIDERKRIEQELIQKQMRLMQQQSGLSDFIRNDKLTRLGWERALQSLMEMTATTLEVARASTWLYTTDRRALRCFDLFEVQGSRHVAGKTLQRADFPKYFAALEAESFIAADDALGDPRTQEFRDSYLLPVGVSSMLDVPILRDGRVEGVICIEHIGEQINWSTDQQVFAAAVASLAAVVLEGRDRMLIEHELRSTNRALEAATSAKSEFLATMSHEIRTPMNGVLGTLELLLDSPLSSGQKNLAVTARSSAESLLGILNDILDYSKLEAAKVELDIVDFSPEQVVDDIVSLFQSRAKSKNLWINVTIDPKLPLWLSGDQDRLRQVLSNLIGNAIKFTERGSINVECQNKISCEGQSVVRFEISDTGIGIPTDAVNRLFTRFSQTDSSTTRKFGGTGLGLAICKQIVELMGGQIGVVANRVEGCTFWFEVPMVEGSEPNRFDDATSQLKPARQLRILVADDNRVNRMIAEMLLAKHGHIVDTAVNGRQAVEAVQTLDYDVVLMDVQMPEMDGITATGQIRCLAEAKRHVKIIALTANAMTGQREEYLANGMNDYVSKPINSTLLFHAIERVTSDKTEPVLETATAITDADRRKKSRRRSDAASDQSIEKLPVFDTSVIAAWSSGMNPTDVSATLQCVPGESIKSLNEIKAAIVAGDLQEAQRVAHRMKGMASNLGATRLAAVARSIEIDAPSIEAASDRLKLLTATTDETLVQLRAIA